MTTTAAGLSEYNIILALDTSGQVLKYRRADHCSYCRLKL